MKEIWLGCPNCSLAFYDDKEYRHHFELDHPLKKFRGAILIETIDGY
ncbi:MAG: hypothetical protein MN733_40595 [Nitrososphaera sp.]|nr:hypothetical protein [Nitrososphaera sp.]